VTPRIRFLLLVRYPSVGLRLRRYACRLFLPVSVPASVESVTALMLSFRTTLGSERYVLQRQDGEEMETADRVSRRISASRRRTAAESASRLTCRLQRDIPPWTPFPFPPPTPPAPPVEAPWGRLGGGTPTVGLAAYSAVCLHQDSGYIGSGFTRIDQSLGNPTFFVKARARQNLLHTSIGGRGYLRQSGQSWSYTVRTFLPWERLLPPFPAPSRLSKRLVRTLAPCTHVPSGQALPCIPWRCGSYMLGCLRRNVTFQRNPTIDAVCTPLQQASSDPHSRNSTWRWDPR
jgi:hypothetical protein